ncbi:MAG: hypothetical protein WD767_02595 [Alphaproteobacteria bacterium]
MIHRQTFASSLRIGGTVALLAGGAVLLQPQSAMAAANCLYPEKLTRAAPSYDCLSAGEKALVEMRKFRAEITVAALRCNQQGIYNELVTRHDRELVVKGKALGTTFKRLHGAKASSELNRFVTFLTNRASIKSLGIQNYCGTMTQVMTDALRVPVRGFMAFIAGNPIGRALAQESPETAAVRVADKSVVEPTSR